MRAVVGSESGLIKVIDVAARRQVVTLGRQERGWGVDALCWAPTAVGLAALDLDTDADDAHGGKRFVTSLHANGTVQLFDLKASVYDRPAGSAAGSGVGTVPLWSAQLVCADAAPAQADAAADAAAAAAAAVAPKAHAGPYCSAEWLSPAADTAALVVGRSAGSVLLVSPTSGQVARSLDVLGSAEVRKQFAQTLCVVRVEPAKYRLATGGKELDVALWDIERGEATWRARNVRDDFLSLRAPVWVTDVAFMPAQPHLLAASTGHHQFRMYDTRSGQRRPLFDHELRASAPGKTNHPLQCLTVSPDGTRLLAGDTFGEVYMLDVRNPAKPLVCGAFQGIAGSVRDLAVHPTLPLLATVSLDRHLRVHNVETRRPVAQFYLKQRLTSLLLAEDSSAVQPVAEAPKKSRRAAANAGDDDSAADDNDDDDSIGEAADPDAPLRKKRSDDDNDDDDDDGDGDDEAAMAARTEAERARERRREAMKAARELDDIMKSMPMAGGSATPSAASKPKSKAARAAARRAAHNGGGDDDDDHDEAAAAELLFGSAAGDDAQSDDEVEPDAPAAGDSGKRKAKKGGRPKKRRPFHKKV